MGLDAKSWVILCFIVVYGIIAFRSLRRETSSIAPPPRSSPLFKAVTIISMFLVLGAVIKVSQYSLTNWKSVRPVMRDDHLPSFTLNSLNGKEQLLSSSLEGKVVLLDFWATWCTPCVVSMPYLEKIYQDYKDKEFIFISVNTERTNQPAVREFILEQNLHFPVYVDSGRLQSQLRVNTYPTAILIDKKGVVRDIHIGATSMVTIRNGIDELLAE